MQTLNNYVLVFLGGGVGACLRHACNLIGTRAAVGSSWPWSTFLVNISGALLMGVVVEAFALRNGASPQLRLLLATGILGGYTTFSTFSLETGLFQKPHATLVIRNTGCFNTVQLKSGKDIGYNQLKCGEHMTLTGIALAHPVSDHAALRSTAANVSDRYASDQRHVFPKENE